VKYVDKREENVISGIAPVTSRFIKKSENKMEKHAVSSATSLEATRPLIEKEVLNGDMGIVATFGPLFQGVAASFSPRNRIQCLIVAFHTSGNVYISAISDFSPVLP